jgi:hypothetical protein
MPGWSDLILLFAPCAIASGVLVLSRLLQRGAAKSGSMSDPNWVIVDGSNVMHWRDNVPDLDPVKQVIAVLAERGFTPGVMFDANAGYKLFGQYRHDHAFGQMLGLPEDRIMVVPKGTPADPYILTAARDMQARIVTNDKFRDWGAEYPEIGRHGYLIGGAYTGKGVKLRLGD